MIPDLFDSRLALRAGPLLAQFNVAGVLDAADVHVAQRLGRLTGERDEQVLLAVALAVRAVRSGSVCVALAEAASVPVFDEDGTLADVLSVTAPEVAPSPDEPGAAAPPPAAVLPWPDPVTWQAAVERSPLVAVGVDGDPNRPVRWVDGRLYLDRYWRDEQLVRAEVDGRITAPALSVEPAALNAAVHRLFPAPADDRQRLAAAACAVSRFTVLTGGPGTGKTTTVARVIAVLQDVAGPDLQVALAAPTGKAAARLQEAVRAEVGELAADDAARVGMLDATTIHRLLGWQPGTSTRFRHNRANRLPHDVVVVDETSMVPLSLMARLLEALRPQARVLLVGDPDQLASVEAGAVLGDLVARPPVGGELAEVLTQVVPDDVPSGGDDLVALRNGVVRLEKVHRYGAELNALAAAIRAGDADTVLGLLRAGGREVQFVETAGAPTAQQTAGLRADVVAAGVALVGAAAAGDARRALEALERHRLLLAHRRGPAGVAYWAALAEAWIEEATDVDLSGPWPLGQPLLVTANDRDTGLYNGDTGVVIADVAGLGSGTSGEGADRGVGGRGATSTVVAFGDPSDPRLIRPHRLPAVQSVHAMTIHRGQGSQFGRVSVVLPAATSPLMTQELLYTAITRAREFVRVIGTEAAVRAAVGRPIRRASGLRTPLGG